MCNLNCNGGSDGSALEDPPSYFIQPRFHFPPKTQSLELQVIPRKQAWIQHPFYGSFREGQGSVREFAERKMRFELRVDLAEKCLAVVAVKIVAARNEHVHADVEGEVRIGNEQRIFSEGKNVVHERGFEEGNADADVVQQQTVEQSGFENEAVETGVRPAEIGVHERQFFHFGIGVHQPAAVDHDGIVSLFNVPVNALIEKRHQRDVHVGVDDVIRLCGFLQLEKHVLDQRQLLAFQRRVDIQNGSFEVGKHFEILRDDLAVFGKLRRVQPDIAVAGKCLRCADAFKRDRLRSEKVGAGCDFDGVEDVSYAGQDFKTLGL